MYKKMSSNMRGIEKHKMLKSIEKSYQFKHFPLLSMFYISALLAAATLVYKFVSFGPFIIPTATLIFPTTYLLGDVIAEVYGYKMSRRLIWHALVCECFFIFTIYFIIKIPSPTALHQQETYNQVFRYLYHIAFASSMAIPAGAFVNAYAITKWKILCQGKYFWLRSLGATALGELVLSIISCIIAFTGVVSIPLMVHMIISVYIVKIIFATVSVYPASIMVMLLKHSEKVDIYDLQTNFNPFKLEI